QMTGSTYSEYSAMNEQRWVMNACEVFPSQIDSRMLHIVSLVNEADQARQAITGISGSPVVEAEQMSYEELDVEGLSAYAEALTEQTSQLESELSAIKAQLSTNESLRVQAADAERLASVEMEQLSVQVENLAAE